MKKHVLKTVSILCAAVMLLSCFSFTAFATEDEQPKITYVKGKNNASESYKESKYYKQMTDLPLTNDTVTDLLAVALSQLGYMESDTDGDFGGTTAGADNYTEYNYNMGDFGEGYGSSSYDWCASFVSFCLLQSRATAQNSMSDWCRNHVADETNAKYDPEYSKYIWREVGCQRWANNLISSGFYRDSASKGGDYLPLPGDLIFFRWSPDKQIGHIGIVVYCDGERVYTVEGNTSGGSTMIANGGGVYFKNYALDYSCIDGYGAMPYEVNEEAEKIDYSGNNATAGIYITTTEKRLYSDRSMESGYTVIPAYTVFKVTDVAEEGIGGMLRAVYELDGEQIKGYIVNGVNERVLQLTVGIPEPEPESFLSFDKTDGFIGGQIDGYTLNGEPISKESPIEIFSIGRIVLNGSFEFDSALMRGGYYIDGDKENIFWIDGCVSEDGKCEIWADIYGISEGMHNLTFVLELENQLIPILDTLSFSFGNEKQTEPIEPEPTEQETEQVTENVTDESDTEAIVTNTEPSGCKSSIGTALIIVLVPLAAITVKRKKN